MNTSTTYKTKQRELILNCLLKNKDKHVTADEIMEYLSKAEAPVGKTTIYRYLDKLVSQGQVRKYFIPEGGSACYQYVDDDQRCHHHFHLKCIDCGKLIHTDCEHLAGLDQHILSHHDFVVDHSKTVLYGQCKSCGLGGGEKNNE